jgi:hypothetical protein
VLAAAANEPVPARQEGARRRAALAVGAGLALVVGSIAASRPSVAGRPVAYVAAIVAAWAVVGAIATWAAATRGRSMLGRPPGWRIAVAAGTPLALVATSMAAAFVWPSPIEDVPAAAHGVCFAMTLGLAAGPLVLLVALHGATDAVRPGLTASALAAAAGAWGAVAIALHCGVAAPAHVLLGHVLPVVLLAVAGIAAGRFVAVRAENG